MQIVAKKFARLKDAAYICRQIHGKPLLDYRKMETIKVNMKKRGLKVDIDRQDFALALKTWRLRNNYTQPQAGKILGGVSRYTIIRAENGQHLTWEMAYKLFARLAHQLEIEKQ